MKYAFCSREFERDYAWEHAWASDALARQARSSFVPAFEGGLTTSRFAVLLRHPEVSPHVVLGVSVSTSRIDFRNRPIRTLAFLEAESPTEEASLLAVFADCLAKPDSQTVQDAASPLAKAVESFYQTKKPDAFLAYAASLSAPVADGVSPKGRVASPRTDYAARNESTRSLAALVRKGVPFLVAIVGRTPQDMLKSLNPLFARGVVCVFSELVNSRISLGDDREQMQKYLRAAAIVIGAFLLIVAVCKSCSGRTDNRSGDHAGDSPESVENHRVGDK